MMRWPIISLVSMAFSSTVLMVLVISCLYHDCHALEKDPAGTTQHVDTQTASSPSTRQMTAVLPLQQSGILTKVMSLPVRLLPLSSKFLPFLASAFGAGLTTLGVTLVRSPLSPLPTPPLPYPPLGKNPIRNTVHMRTISDLVPIGYHYRPPVHHPTFNVDRNDVSRTISGEMARHPRNSGDHVISIIEVPTLIVTGPRSRINLPLITNWFQPYSQNFPKVLFLENHPYGVIGERRSDDAPSKVGKLKRKSSGPVLYKRKKIIEINEKKSAKRQGALDRLLKSGVIRSMQAAQRSSRSISVHRERRDIGAVSRDTLVDLNVIDNNRPSEFGRAMERMIGLTSPTARSRLQSLWKRLRSILLTTASSSFAGGNSERADELTKALFQQLFKQFDLPAILRRRADKLRRRVGGPSSSSGAVNSTESDAAKVTDDGVRLVDFRKKTDDNTEMSETDKAKNGVTNDQQIRHWVDMVAEEDKKVAQTEKIEVDPNLGLIELTVASSTTASPSSTPSTRYPTMQSIFQRRKGPIRVAVKVPQKHAKSGITRFQPAQRALINASQHGNSMF